LRLPFVGPFILRADFIPKPVYRRGAYLGLRRRRRAGPEGALMPQPAVRTSNGLRCRLDDVLTGDFVLLGADTDPRTALDADRRAWCDRNGVQFAVIYPWGGRPYGDVAQCWPKDLVELEDVSGAWFDWLKAGGARKGSVVILRPDRFVFAVVPAAKLDAAIAQLQLALGTAGAETQTARTAETRPLDSSHSIPTKEAA
jgi:3-(3-hydroxy-phenyl)propionate hydroxylase